MKHFLLALAMCACTTQVYPEEPKKRPITVEGANDIERTCNKLRALGCSEAKETPEGNTCEAVLTNAAENGIDLVGDVVCVLDATSCAAVENCND